MIKRIVTALESIAESLAELILEIKQMKAEQEKMMSLAHKQAAETPQKLNDVMSLLKVFIPQEGGKKLGN